MRIVFLTQYYPPEIGAPQARLSELASHFVERGHSVTVLTAMPNYPTGKIYSGYGGLLTREFRDGVHVIRTFIYPTQRADFLRRLTNYFSFVISSSICGSSLLARPDYLMVESPPLFLGLAGVWLSRIKGAKLIFNVSDLWPDSAVFMGLLRSESLSYRMAAKLESFCYRNAWMVSGQSKSIISDIAKRFPECHTFHLSNGVDIRRFGPDRRTETARAELTDNGECVALYAGLHGLAQGLDQVLNVAEALKTENGFRFVLLGDGPEKRTLIERARQQRLTNVEFLNPRPSQEIPALLAATDLALITLKNYIPGAVPSKLYEAMASGRPVVLTAKGEAAEIVREHEAGFAVEPGDIRGLAEVLRLLRDDSQLRLKMGENGRRAAEQYFDRAKIAAKFINHLEAEL